MQHNRNELRALHDSFIDAFNRMDIDGVVGFFADDAIYEDIRGDVHTGHEAIRAAFEPLLQGAMGNISFDGEDYFADPESNKVMSSWTLNIELDGKPMRMRGMDILQFSENKLTSKRAYCKSVTPKFDEG